MAFQQLEFLLYDLRRIVGQSWWRWLTCWFGSGACVLVSYRLDRMFFLLLGNPWGAIRPLFFPLFLVLRLLSANHDIHYRAEIGKGLNILHCALGVVVSGHTVAGDYLTLTGGNCIGSRMSHLSSEPYSIGHHVVLGANAVILGPVTIGNHVVIGANAVVTHDIDDYSVVAGVPARLVRKMEAKAQKKSSVHEVEEKLL